VNGNLHLEEKDARRREATGNDIVEALKQGENLLASARYPPFES
jgi:hypothetical protein